MFGGRGRGMWRRRVSKSLQRCRGFGSCYESIDGNQVLSTRLLGCLYDSTVAHVSAQAYLSQRFNGLGLDAVIPKIFR